MSNESLNEGYIVVRVSTARGAIPLPGAEVIIRTGIEDGANIISSMISSNSGLTSKIALPSPSKSLSDSPGALKPYATYNIEVRADGYSTQFYNDVPVFEGITSYQNAMLIPLPDNINSDNFTYDSSYGFESIQKRRMDI